MSFLLFLLFNGVFALGREISLSLDPSFKKEFENIPMSNAVAVYEYQVRHCTKMDLVRCTQLPLYFLRQNNQRMGAQFPGAYYYLGMGFYFANDFEQAVHWFEKAVEAEPEDYFSWDSLAESYLSLKKLGKAADVMETFIFKHNGTHCVFRLAKARRDMADWKDFELLQYKLHEQIKDAIAHNVDSVLYPPGLIKMHPKLHLKAIQSYNSRYPPKPMQLPKRKQSSKLKLGFINSEFGRHPVVQLMRGAFEMLDKSKFELYCFETKKQNSFWRRSVVKYVKEFVSLIGMDTEDAANTIAKAGIDILIDLNGLSVNYATKILAYQPAPLQATFLGYPLSFGVSYIDLFITDAIAAPPDHEHYYTEKLAYHPTTSLVNDQLQLLGSTKVKPKATREEAQLHDLNDSTLVFASFCNWKKIDPVAFSSWMQVLRIIPDSVLWFIHLPGHQDAIPNLIRTANAMGIDAQHRFRFTPLAVWTEHTWIKGAADLVFDSTMKNGHTTINDVLWAGVPFVTLEGGAMQNRVASSLANTMDLDMFVTHSHKEYIDVAIQLAKNKTYRLQLRGKMEQNSLKKTLFNTKLWTRLFEDLLQTAWEQSVVAKKGHIFTRHKSSNELDETLVPVDGLTTKQFVRENEITSIENHIDKGMLILLHIGAKNITGSDEWTNINVMPGPHVDLQLDMRNLSIFPNNSVTTIYASHVLEHVCYALDNELMQTLKEWHRVLKPGGELLISVPDLRVLSNLFTETKDPQHKFHIMRMMFGGQTNEYDFHKVGFDRDILSAYLSTAGFSNVTIVDSFNLFKDASELVVLGKAISLNVKALAS